MLQKGATTASIERPTRSAVLDAGLFFIAFAAFPTDPDTDPAAKMAGVDAA